MTDDAAPRTTKSETEREAHPRQDEIRRALEAAERAGLSDYRVEIGPDGTIAIVVGAAS